MTTQQNDDTSLPPVDPTVNTGSTPPSSTSSTGGSELENLRLENTNLLEQLKRERADFLNYKKRVQDEWQNWFRKGKTEAVLALVPVLENLPRAYASLPETMRGEPWAQGIEHIIQLGEKQLAHLRIERIPTLDKPFDSELHEAVSQTDGEEGIVMHEIEPGYLLEGKPISVAKVVIGNGATSTKSEP